MYREILHTYNRDWKKLQTASTTFLHYEFYFQQPLFGSIVYSQVILCIHQNFLQGVVHVIFRDQWNQAARLHEIQVTVIYSRARLFAVKSGCSVKRVICKIWTRTLANSAEPDQSPPNSATDQGLHGLLKLQAVQSQMIYSCPRSGPFPQPTLSQQCCQFSLLLLLFLF